MVHGRSCFRPTHRPGPHTCPRPLPCPPLLVVYAAASVTLVCLRMARSMLLGVTRGHPAPPADLRPAAASAAPASAQYQEQQQPALPPLRTKPASRHTPGLSLSPSASPRKAHPAAAGAAAALVEAVASKSAPCTPSALNGGVAHLSNSSPPCSPATAAASAELSGGMTTKAAATGRGQSPCDSNTPPAAATGVPSTPIVAEEPADTILQRNSVVAAA